MTVANELDLETLFLKAGSHNSREDGVCAMEAVAWLAGEPHSAAPQCASRVITNIVIRLNDRWSDEDRQLLKPYLPRIIGTRGSAAVEERRSYMASDWATRVAAALWLRRTGFDEQAAQLEGLAEIIDPESARAARVVLEEVKRTTRAARDEARKNLRARVEAELKDKPADAVAAAVAAAAADAVAVAAAAAAAVAAADADAVAAAVAAAVKYSSQWWKVYNETYAAAKKVFGRSLAGEQFRPTVEEIHRSALGLLDRLIDCSQVAA